MSGSMRWVFVAVAALPLLGSASAALAATAHNSQAGAWGPNSHTCAPTPYFPAGGCADTALRDIFDDETLPPPGRYDERRPLRRPDR